MKRILVFSILLSVLAACNHHQNKDSKLFSFSKDDAKAFKLEALQQIFKSVKLLDLKNNIAPLLKIKKIYFDTKQLYVVEPTGKLYVYDKASGKQQFIINKKGQGPQEYLNIDDVILQGNEIHIYSKNKKQILKFKKSDGAFIGSKTVGIYANGGVIKYNNSIFFSHNTGEYLVTKTDTNYMVQKKYLKNIYRAAGTKMNTFFKSNKGLFYVFPFSDSLYQYSNNQFRVYKVIRDKGGDIKNEINKRIIKHYPVYSGSFIYNCFISNNVEFARIFFGGFAYVKKNNVVSIYLSSKKNRPFIDRIPDFSRNVDGNSLYIRVNDAFGFKEYILKYIDDYKKLSQDKNCPYAELYKTILKKLPEINEDTSPLVFVAEIND